MPAVTAPITGIVAQVLVDPGQEVAAGQDVAVIESMKMHIPVPAEQGGVVRAVRVRVQDFVQEGDVLAEVEPLQ